MPFPRPTLTTLRTQAQQDITNAGIPGVDAFLRFAVLPILTFVQAALSWLHYDYLDYIAKQAVPWTATDENLAGWATLKGVAKKPASTATSPGVSFPATGAATIPAGTQATRSDGWIYQTTAASVTASGVTVAPVVSVTAGSAGNALSGTQMQLASPVAGIQSTGSLTAAATGGADIETDDAFRSRVMAKYQEAGSIGRAAEYKDWATAVPGVTRAWVNAGGAGTGSLVVYIMLDEANAATGGFPMGTDGAASEEARYVAATGDQLTVAEAIWPNRAVTALVVVASPIAQPTNFVISDLGSGNTAANQAAIKIALQDMFTRLSAPGGTIHPNSWDAALASISALSTFAVTSPIGPVSGANVGAMPTLGTVVFGS